MSRAHLIRAANMSDLVDIVNNEMTAHFSPWSEKSLADSITSDHLFWVLSCQQKVVGHLVVMPALDQWELLNIVIQREKQGHGLGIKLLEYLLAEAENHQIKSIFLEVRVSNMTAISLYEKYGFLTIGRRKNYYHCKTGMEDALVMQVILSM